MAQVKPIPDGYPTIIPHLVVQGGSEAIAFYKKAFGAVELSRMPMPDGKLMHAQLKIGDSYLFLCDGSIDKNWQATVGQGHTCSPVTMHLSVENADAFFDRAVTAGAVVKMPLTDMFWGDRYGQLVDPFGHVWAVATHKEDVSPEEMQKRGRAMMAQMGKGKA
jgi:uncharacterized glyoxalase superfamily protein PhnB